MTGQELVQRTQQVVATVEHPAFLEQIEALLPDTVPLRRFVQVAKTAIRTTPDLVEADQTSLFGALVRCAQDGLFPDGREAALVPYKGKVSYIPMIGGIRKVAADHGWTIRTRVVHANDEFEYTEEPPVIRHTPVRPGTDRGNRIAAYAVATHKDGRREQIVLHPDQIAKRQSKAQTDKVWKEWPEAMWEKSAGHALFPQLAITDLELVDRINHADETDPAEAAESLYGPDGSAFKTTPAASPAESPRQGDGDRQQATSGGTDVSPHLPAAAAAGPDTDDEPEPGPPVDERVEAAAGAVVPSGNYQGMTLGQIGDLGEDGEKWLDYALRHRSKYDDEFVAALDAFVQARLPQVWERYAERTAA